MEQKVTRHPPFRRDHYGGVEGGSGPVSGAGPGLGLPQQKLQTI